MVKITWFLSFSGKNDAESLGHFVKIPFWDLKRAKLDQNSDLGHVRTLSWLHKLRNTQGKLHGTYLGNIYKIYKECMRNIHSYLWYKIIRNTDPMGRPPKAASVFLIILYHKYLWIFLIYSLYIPYIYMFPRYVPYIFPCVFLILWRQQKKNLAPENWVL